MGSCEGGSGVVVVVKRREVILATGEVQQEHWVAMSNLDLLLPPLKVGIVLCYKKLDEEEEERRRMIEKMKEGLSEMLVSYYTLGGEVVENSQGEPELLCNNRGVDFLQAYAPDTHLQHLPLYDASTLSRHFVPPIKFHGVLSIQVTELRCGGLVIGCSFDHRVADAHSVNMFLVAWAQYTSRPTWAPTAAAATNNISSSSSTTAVVVGQPCYRRSLLNPRRPGHYNSASMDHMYVLIKSIRQKKHDDDDDDVVPAQWLQVMESRIYHITRDQIERLQYSCNTSQPVDHGMKTTMISKRSKLESFSAFLWKLLAIAASTSTTSSSGRRLQHDHHNNNSISNYVVDDDVNKIRCKLGIVVNGRKFLTSNSTAPDHQHSQEPTTKNICKTCSSSNSMENYFGNVLSVPYTDASVGELKALPLCKIADMVHECIEGAANEEHFRGLIDWVEERRPEKAMCKVYCGSEEAEVAVVVSSGQRFPVKKLDFGWGSPVFGSYSFPWGSRQTGYVMPMPSATNGDDWVVYMHLLQKHLDFLEKEAPHVFKPFTTTTFI